MDERALEGEYSTLIRGDKGDVTLTRDGQYNINLRSKRSDPRKTPTVGNSDDNEARYVDKHVKAHEGGDKVIKTPSEDVQLALRANKGDNHTKAPCKADDKTPYGYGKNTFNRGDDTHSTPTVDRHYSARIPGTAGPRRSLLKEAMRLVKEERSNV